MTPTDRSVDIDVHLDGRCVRCRRKTITYSAPGSAKGICSDCLVAARQPKPRRTHFTDRQTEREIGGASRETRHYS